MEKKYEMTDYQILYNNHVLSQIKAVKNIPSINLNTGDFGGYIEKEENLSHEGNCWVDDDAMVFWDAKVCDDAHVYNNAKVFNHAHVSGNARVYNDTIINNAHVSDNFKSTIGIVRLKSTNRIGFIRVKSVCKNKKGK